MPWEGTLKTCFPRGGCIGWQGAGIAVRADVSLV